MDGSMGMRIGEKLHDMALLIKAEFKRDLLFMKRYPLEPLSFLFFMYVILMAIIFGFDELLNVTDKKVLNHEIMILGYCLMQYTLAAQMGWSGQIQNESQTGTLEQLSISGHNLGDVLLSRGIAQFPRHVFSFFLLLFAYSLSLSETRIIFAHIPEVILTLFITGLGIFGVAYVFAGVTLIFKRVGFFFQIANFGFLGLFWLDRTGMEPSSWKAVLYDNFPLTQGMSNLRLLMLAPQRNPGLAEHAGLGHLLLISLISLCLGYLAFLAMEKRARKLALLSQY